MSAWRGGSSFAWTLAALFANVAFAQFDGRPAINDPFLQVTDGIASCPRQEATRITEAQGQAHRRRRGGDSSAGRQAGTLSAPEFATPIRRSQIRDTVRAELVEAFASPSTSSGRSELCCCSARDIRPADPARRISSPAFTGRQRSQGGAEFPTGGICGQLQEPASARFRPMPVSGSADLVRCQSRRSQSG